MRSIVYQSIHNYAAGGGKKSDPLDCEPSSGGRDHHSITVPTVSTRLQVTSLRVTTSPNRPLRRLRTAVCQFANDVPFRDDACELLIGVDDDPSTNIMRRRQTDRRRNIRGGLNGGPCCKGST
jgi:hypothetical protein